MSRITLQDVENIVAQLSLDDQLKLIAHVSEHLKDTIPSEIDEEQWRRENAERIKAFLKLSINMSAKVTGARRFSRGYSSDP